MSGWKWDPEADAPASSLGTWVLGGGGGASEIEDGGEAGLGVTMATSLLPGETDSCSPRFSAPHWTATRSLCSPVTGPQQCCEPLQSERLNPGPARGELLRPPP